MSEAKKPKAGERLTVIETQLMNFDSRNKELQAVVFSLSRENEILKDALQLLHEKQDAVISLINEGKGLSDENINSKVVKSKEGVLKQKVDNMLEAGNIEVVETVGDDSFIVSRELSKEGKVENPRLQFLVGRLTEDLKSKFIGKKVGDLIKGEENKFDVEIAEIYNFVEVEVTPEDREFFNSEEEETKE